MNVVPADALPQLLAQSGGKGQADGFIGIRPEHVYLGGAQQGSVPVTVELVESLGVETLTYVRLPNNVQVVSRAAERSSLHPGQQTHLTFEPGFTHYFDRAGKTCGAV